MSPQHERPNDESGPAPLRTDFAELRSRKRDLLAEQDQGWGAGRPPVPEDLLRRWPTVRGGDDDVASVLFADLMQRRAHGEQASVADYSQRFPEHVPALAGLVSHQELLQSIGGDSHTGRCTLRFPGVGDELFGFRFRAELGRGSFARVFLAEQTALAGRAVAVKVSAIEGNEPQTLAQMQHTHIVPIYAVQDDQRSGLRAVCMPYFGGASLSQVLQLIARDRELPSHGQQLADALERVQCPTATGPTTGTAIVTAGFSLRPNLSQAKACGYSLPPKALRDAQTPASQWRGMSYVHASAWIVARLADGLQHAHDRGVLHRDIKPSNILLGADGQPMLLDFNLAQDQHTDAAEAVLGGTVAYMAPEHLRAMSRRDPAMTRLVDERSDVYALGMVLYEMLTGKKPFEHSGSYSVLPLQLEAMAVERSKGSLSARSQRPDVPWSLESILRKCLAPDRAARYQRAEHLAEDLRCLLEDAPLRHAPELSRVERLAKWRRRHPRLTYAGGVTLVASLLLGIAGFALATVQTHLEGTQVELDVAKAKERRQAFEALTTKALCLVNTTIGPRDHLEEGIKVCDEALALYGVLAADDWQEPRDWQDPSRDERRLLAEDTRELLMLLAAARVRRSPGEKAVLHQAVHLLDLAEAIPDLTPSRALQLDRAHYVEVLGDAAHANTIRHDAAQIPVASAREHYQLATSLTRNGAATNAAQAIAELDKAIALDGRHYWSWLQRGICHTEAGDLVLAAADFGHCTGLWPAFAWGHFNLGYVQAQSGKLPEAVASYSRALERDAELAAARTNRGLAFLELKRYAEALADLDQALRQRPDDPSVHAGRAMALEALKRYAEADEAFRLAFAKLDDVSDDVSAAARLQMRWTYAFAVAGRLPDEARQTFLSVLRADPRNHQALYGLAMLTMQRGSASEALRYFDQTIEAAPHFLAARCYRAVQLARTGALKRAGDDINWCLEKEPRSGAALYAAACVAALAAQHLGDAQVADQAVDLLGKALAQGVGLDKAETDPDLAGLHAHPGFREHILSARGPQMRTKARNGPE